MGLIWLTRFRNCLAGASVAVLCLMNTSIAEADMNRTILTFSVHATLCENSACEPVTLQILRGDRFVMYRWGNHREDIRIANIDAPDGQARCPGEQTSARRAADRLGQKLNGSAFTLARIDADRGGNTLAFVSIDHRDLGHELIRKGVVLPWEPKHRSWCSGWR